MSRQQSALPAKLAASWRDGEGGGVLPPEGGGVAATRKAVACRAPATPGER